MTAASPSSSSAKRREVGLTCVYYIKPVGLLIVSETSGKRTPRQHLTVYRLGNDDS
ncbi:hypothetical protein BH24DEI2_BH24DEI2_13510 [soil metagenome]